MSKVIIFSDMYTPTFPFLEVPLYHELEKRGINVTYVLYDGDPRINEDDLRSVYEKLNLVVIKKNKQILDIIEKNDLLVMRFAYKGPGGNMANLCRSKRVAILMYDPGGVDIRFRRCPAHYLTAKSESLKQQAAKKFPGAYKKIYVTGSIHYDDVVNVIVDRNEFMRDYGMDPHKKFAIITPANPGEAWMKGLQEDYKRIVGIVKEKCPGYELAIKAHPLDYTASMPVGPGIIHKNQHYGGKHSWEIIAPDIPVIKPSHGYMAIRACDVVINIRSSLAMEIPGFKKPLINVNRHKYITNWPFDKNTMLDIKIEKLAEILNKNMYTVNERACKAYMKKYTNANGKACIKTANAIEEIIGRK